jgi:nicotinamidase-related amidase
MKPALLLVDLQRDFLERPGLTPSSDQLVAQCASLVEGCRVLNIPVAHVRTVIHRRLDNRMPHWKRNGYWACVSGTPGCDPPAPLLPLGEERVFEKSYYSAFGNPLLERVLREMGADTLILAGVYLHSCVRATALDGYERGYTVWVAEDAVGTTEPLHADMTRSYLHGRAVEFLHCEEILERLGRTRTTPVCMAEASHPVGYVAGRPVRAGRSHELWEHRNPARWDEVLGHVALATPRDAEAAVTDAARAFSRWRHSRHQERVDLLNAWSEGLIRRVDALAGCMAEYRCSFA